MKRSLVLLAVLPFTLVACDSGVPVVVDAAVTQTSESTEARPLSGLPIRLLPYDRDVIFDSLSAASATPEPQIPAEILQQQAAVQSAQEEWQAANDRWSVVRDSLRTLTQELQRMQQQGQRATPQYNQLFQQSNRLFDEEARLKQQADASFQRYTQLQEATQAQADSIRVVREVWGDEAFRDYDEVVAARLESLRREEIVDTTDAAGRIRVRVPEGRWWIYSRYTLPFSELYWNVPLEVRGDSVVVQLNRQNAEARPLM